MNACIQLRGEKSICITIKGQTAYFRTHKSFAVAFRHLVDADYQIMLGSSIDFPEESTKEKWLIKLCDLLTEGEI